MTVGLSQLRVMLSKCAAPVGFLPQRPSWRLFFNELIHYIQINHIKIRAHNLIASKGLPRPKFKGAIRTI